MLKSIHYSHVNLIMILFYAVAPKTATITGTREAKAGETLTLTCTTSNSNPAAIIEWIPRKENGANIRSRTEESPDGGYITISEIDITLSNTQTSAIYTCSAENRQLGITIADTATVGVLCKSSCRAIFRSSYSILCLKEAVTELTKILFFFIVFQSRVFWM